MVMRVIMVVMMMVMVMMVVIVMVLIITGCERVRTAQWRLQLGGDGDNC